MKRIAGLSVIVILILLVPHTGYSQELIRAGVFGSYGGDFIHGYSIDEQGDLVICGTFQRTIDLDMESGGQANLIASSKNEVYVAKYDIKGKYLWAFSLRGDTYDSHWVKDIATDKAGNIFITGFADGWIDFDPSVNVDSIWIEDKMFYIAKYNSDGEYQWAHGFGNEYSGSLVGWSLALDKTDGSVYVSGTINDSIDFDPSGESAILDPETSKDFFLAKYTNDGAYIWAELISPSGTGNYGSPLRLVIDESRNIYLGGYFEGVYDMDPSESVNNLESNGLTDGFLSKYDKDGNYIWAINIGSGNSDYIRNFRIFEGNIYAVGSFQDTVDFDASEGTFELYTADDWSYDGFLSVYGTDGSFVSAMSIQGKKIGENYSGSEIHDIDFDIHKDYYIIGSFYGTADFDSSDGSAELTSTGGISDRDMFMAKYNMNDQYQWAFNIGGMDQETGFFTNVTKYGEVIAFGYYDGSCDFDPSDGENWISNKGSHDVYLAWYYAYTPTGIPAENASEGEVTVVYPNPANQYLILESTEQMQDIHIYNATGSLIQAREVHSKSVRIDLSDLPAGYYLLRINQDSGVENHSFMKLE